MPVDKAMVLAMMAAARDARENAYAPHSNFKVGAAVRAESGKVYLGCNVENVSSGLTVCAERVAIQKAISEGERAISVVVVVAGEQEIARPCGACLQVMREFAPSNEPLVIAACALDGSYDTFTLDDYLPMPFLLSD